ncbi:MAG: helix-turn-helix domain-containing protein [Planctomycetes bacterium]|nr:helix-turn-helix domain-containing protein [Planctomycetota bacterium]
MLPSEPHQSLSDGIECLMLLAGAPRPMPVGDIADRLGLDVIRARRLLQTLVHAGLAALTSERRYRLGHAAHALGARCLAGSGALAAALPVLADLAPGSSIELGTLWRDEVTILHRRSAVGHLEAPPRDPLAATRSAIGLALLAWHSADEVRGLFTAIDGSLKPVPGFPSYGDLVEALDHARASGHARLLVSSHPHSQALAMAIGDPPCMAVAVTGAFSDDQASIIAALRAAVARIAAALPRSQR